MGALRLRRLHVAALACLAISSIGGSARAAEGGALAHYWSMAPTSGGSIAAGGVTMDPTGNTIVAGSYTGTVGLGGPQLSSAGAQDVFVGKLSSAGAHLWSKTFGDNGADLARAVATDASGNVLVAGQFEGTISFGGANLTSLGGADIFVAKFGPSGAHLLSAAFGSPGSDVAYGIATASDSSFVVVGAASGPINFGGGVRAHAGDTDIFAASFTSAGAHRWSKLIGSTGADEARAVASTSGGAVALTGSFQGTVDFGGGSLTSLGSSDVFLASFSSLGAHSSSSRHGWTSFDAGYGIASTSTGVLGVTGRFSGEINFGTGPVPTNGNTDVFVAILPPDPSARWVGAFGDNDTDIGRAIAADSSGNFVVTGTFEDRIDFGIGPALHASGPRDVFAARLDQTGKNLWSRGFGGSGSDEGRGVAAGAGGLVSVTGDFFEAINLGGAPLSSDGGGVFIGRFGPDVTAPTTVITTANPALLLSLPTPTPVEGTVTDAAAGVSSVTVTFTPILPPAVSVQATLQCDAFALACTWEALPPGPGFYTVRAVATDRSGNVESPGPTITIVAV